jgi:thiamine-phosphate pyrophosphorylase
MKPLSECRLYAFVDTAYLHGRSPEHLAQQLCDGGADLIQLRAKGLPQSDVLRMAEGIVRVTRQAGVGLVINDYPAIAQQVGAELCHLGQEDFFDAGHSLAFELRTPHTLARRSEAQEGLFIGLSTHSPEQARRALAAGPDYIAIGPVYATGTKPGAKPVTLDYVRWAAANVSMPWFAIGGITLENVENVLAAGARRICVVSAILNATDVAAACREFKHRL